jgi:hypothetical protein
LSVGYTWQQPRMQDRHRRLQVFVKSSSVGWNAHVEADSQPTCFAVVYIHVCGHGTHQLSLKKPTSALLV